MKLLSLQCHMETVDIDCLGVKFIRITEGNAIDTQSWIKSVIFGLAVDAGHGRLTILSWSYIALHAAPCLVSCVFASISLTRLVRCPTV